MSWLRALQRLRAQRRPAVLVTVTGVRGHAPRDPGVKMVVAADGCWGTVGGGNLEESALRRARMMLDDGALEPETLALELNPHAQTEYGRQCCGGEVELLLEPVPAWPAVAIFGMGHVGRELALLLSRHEVLLHLVDSRADRVDEELSSFLGEPLAEITIHHAPVPELVLGQIPPGTQVLVMTHDHAEDAALVDAALRVHQLGEIGVIGSSAKWAQFRKLLAAQGNAMEAIDRVQCPIGDSRITGKSPATIAVAIAAQLIPRFEHTATATAAKAGHA